MYIIALFKERTQITNHNTRAKRNASRLLWASMHWVGVKTRPLEEFSEEFYDRM